MKFALKETLKKNFNVPNTLTAIRMLLIPVYIVLFVRGLKYTALIVFLAASFTDMLDGMIARATGTASPLGRMLDGLCDHGVFVVIYVALGLAVNTTQGWVLMWVAGIAHAIQSNLFEAERTRFHRRAKGDPGEVAPVRTRMALERLYDSLTGVFDRAAARFDRALAAAPDRRALG